LLATVVVCGVVYSIFGVSGLGGVIVGIVLVGFGIISILNLCIGTTVKKVFFTISRKSTFIASKFLSKMLFGETSDEQLS
jgi:hypothetical protein